MNNKKIISLIIIAILIIIAGIFVYKNKDSLKNKNLNNKNSINILSFEDKKITDETKPFKIDITYPEIAGQNEFNNLVKNIIDKEISDFKNNSLENDNAVKEIDPESYAKYPRTYDLIINYNKGQLDDDLASVVFDIYNFEGGAHGASYQKVLNYDFKNKKELTLADVFTGQNDYLQKISDYCIKDLTNQIIKATGNTEGAWIADGAGPIVENFQIFLINKDNITFYFPQYQVAPGAFGGFKVVMPR
jgi:hypothetical protein